MKINLYPVAMINQLSFGKLNRISGFAPKK